MLKRSARLMMMLVLMCILLTFAALAEDSGLLSFRLTGTPSRGSVSVYQEPSSKSGEIAKVTADAPCEIIGTTGSYYRVRVGDSTGYALKSKLTQTVVAADVPLALCDSVSLMTATPNRHEKHLMLQGTITAREPIESLYVFVWDERQQAMEYTYALELEAPVTQIDAAVLEKVLPIIKFDGGRKFLVVEGAINGQMQVLFRSPAYITGELIEPVSITKKIRGLPAAVTDTKVSTAWVPRKSEPDISFRIPDDRSATLLTLEWKTLPDSFTVELMDQDKQVLSTVHKDSVFYMESVVLTPEVRRIRVSASGKDAALATLRVYGDSYPANDVQQWQPLPDKLDMLVVSTHQDDEFLFFGGTIPYYAAREDCTLGVLYMTDCGRLRYREALNGLWCSGLRHRPIFLGLEDFYTMSVGKARALWRDDDPEKLLVRIFRQYKPEVIIAQDFNGEYGHAQHKYTTELVAQCIPLAADPAYDPASAEQWGPWQVKKCYMHLYEENQIRMNWDVPLDETGVITPMFLAWEGYDKNKSQLSSFSMEQQGVMYDNTLFGLYHTTVGPDVEKNDFMENIP